MGPTAWSLNIGREVFPETSVTTNLRFVTSHKGEDLIYITTEVSNHEI